MAEQEDGRSCARLQAEAEFEDVAEGGLRMAQRDAAGLRGPVFYLLYRLVDASDALGWEFDFDEYAQARFQLRTGLCQTCLNLAGDALVSGHLASIPAFRPVLAWPIRCCRAVDVCLNYRTLSMSGVCTVVVVPGEEV